jgi:hypothetical protein
MIKANMIRTKEIVEPGEDAESLERTIGLMSLSNACIHPVHYHSFRGVSLLLPLARTCAGCCQRLQPVVFDSGSNSTNQAVQCVACGAFAHRSCGFSRDTIWNERCSVNLRFSEIELGHDSGQACAEHENSADILEGTTSKGNTMYNDSALQGETAASSDPGTKRMFPFFSKTPPSISKPEEVLEQSASNEDAVDDNESPPFTSTPESDDVALQGETAASSDLGTKRMFPFFPSYENELGHDSGQAWEENEDFAVLLEGSTSKRNTMYDDVTSHAKTVASTYSGTMRMFPLFSKTPSSISKSRIFERELARKQQPASNEDDVDENESPQSKSVPESDDAALHIETVASSDPGTNLMFPFFSKTPTSISKSRDFEEVLEQTASNENDADGNGSPQQAGNTKRPGAWPSVFTSSVKQTDETETAAAAAAAAVPAWPFKAMFPFRSATSVLLSNSKDETANITQDLTDTSMNDGGAGLMEGLEWTADGPPRHWTASMSHADGPIPIASPVEEGEHSAEDGEDAGNSAPLHFATHPFSSVSRALQENIIAHFRPVVVDSYLLKHDEARNDTVVSNCGGPKSINRPPPTVFAAEHVQSRSFVQTATLSKTPSEVDVEGLLAEVKPKEETSIARKRLGLATVAGGIAGGFAGLVMAGPVGGVIGVKCGQTAGILSIILEGSVSIGVFASGIAAGSTIANELQDKLHEKRVLAFGEEGTERRLLLVRPTVKTDPIWDTIYAEARKLYAGDMPGIFSFQLLANETQTAKRERYEREFDIVKTGEDEIPTGDKILLLVSRILNDKLSLAGYVHRHLLGVFRERCKSRGPLPKMVGLHADDDDGASGNGNNDYEKDNSVDLLLAASYRARRQDVHAMIKCVTAALLEVRPGFSASPAITELTATAVEGLVFGEVYDLVLEEIEAAFDDRDNALLEKIAEFERSQGGANDSQDGQGGESSSSSSYYKKFVSEPALEALHQLPEAHSAVDKLRYCVVFLERISEHFAASSTNNTTVAIGADSLLKMTCQHILMAKVFGINAQVAFLEEFARDEQLLRGREGYALVTLQASLHFLNLSHDFEKDIFNQDDQDGGDP